MSLRDVPLPIEKLIPNIERRLSAWVTVQERVGRVRSREPRRTITIARQFGCEGYPLAESLKASLDERTEEPWTIFDKALIERVSRETHLSERLLSNIGDTSHILDKFATLFPGWRTHSEAYEQLARSMVRIALEGNAIIVGRGGAVVLQSLPHCFHFRLEAPFEHRVVSIQQRLSLARDEAAALVVEHQQRRERFVESLLGCSLADTRHYDAVFNTAKNSVERITRSILELIAVPVEPAKGGAPAP